tara:strand:- start:2198 stop:2572 length:375 start_codon:yes stop_codon:yes gene_type:complete
MSEQVEEIIDIEEDRLKYRVEYIRENLVQLSDKLRENIPQGLTDEDLTKDDTFKNWVVVNSIYDASVKDSGDDGFNRMLYYLYDKSRGNIARLVSNYDINIKFNTAGQLEDIKLIVLEEEESDE